MLDTGQNIQESTATLLMQQQRLLDGRRAVQMFPTNTVELPLPTGMQRTQNSRGVFHFNPQRITAAHIQKLSAMGRENELLELGPYSKPDIRRRLMLGEDLLVVTEYTPQGVEVRAAAGCSSTVAEQMAYFNATKDPQNFVLYVTPERVKKEQH